MFTGKYDFKGIKKVGGAGLRVALAQSPYTSWILAWSTLTEFLSEALVNWLANHGLLILNIGAIYREGEVDQKALDDQMNKALSEITIKGGRDKLTAAEKRAIDNEVIKHARKFIVLKS